MTWTTVHEAKPKLPPLLSKFFLFSPLDECTRLQDSMGDLVSIDDYNGDESIATEGEGEKSA